MPGAENIFYNLLFTAPSLTTGIYCTIPHYRYILHHPSIQVYTAPSLNTGIYCTIPQYRYILHHPSLQVYTAPSLTTGIYCTIPNINTENGFNK
jgi:hypothetical protein